MVQVFFKSRCDVGNVKEDVEKEEAEKLKKILEEAGGTVELK